LTRASALAIFTLTQAREICGIAEAVRLVVWDLDNTFWRGTVTEGGL
jgi:predicted enzyme involved in methoxymalonyl-ACP biosynthesis